MLTHQEIKRGMANTLGDTDFLNLPNPKRGKVRDSYVMDDRIVLITTDRQSAFDRVLASVPFKGQVLNQVSAFWFEKTRDIVPNHVIDIPDPNVTVARKCEVFPIEFVMRGYLTGSTSTSAWTQYAAGERNICGNVLPDGMVKNQRFDEPILTPTTKDDEHDESISAEEIVSRGIIEKRLWKQLEETAFALFERGRRIAAEHGLILVDTKYELGLDDKGEIVLIDEIHTPDSSRWWLAEGYQKRFDEGLEPENIDKEFLRLWFKEHCDPYKDEELPPAPDDLVVELSSRYIRLYEMITGETFKANPDEDVRARLADSLAGFGR